MKKLVTIARALKEKNRVAGRLAKARLLVSDTNSTGKKEYEAVLSKGDTIKEIESLQRRADDIQDALDEFNARTKVEIEID